MFFVGLLSICLGLVFGSFISAYSYRLPKRISIAKGRSFCPNCKNMIHWFDNLPLISYLILGGKCRNCKKHISLRYPLIEASTSLGFLYIFLNYSYSFPQLLYYLVIFCLLILIFVIDLEHQIIPDSLIYSGIIVSFIFFLFTSNLNLLFPSVFAGFIAAALLMSIHLLTRGRGMGLGDVKFAVLGGMLVGLNLTLIWLFLSFLTGGITGTILILGRRAGLKDQIAFGPFLVIGIILTFLYGEGLLRLLGF